MFRHEHLMRLAITLVATVLVAACTTSSAVAPSASIAQQQSPKPVASASAVAAASAAPTPTQQPLEVTGKFALEPAHGSWDTKVVAAATGLKPATKYDLVWTTGKVQWKLSDDRSKYLGRTASAVQKVLQSPTTDTNGAFQASFTVPQGFGYAHDVMVVDAQRVIRNKSLFDVDMVTTISPTSGPPGTPITVEVKGIGWQSYQNSFQLDWDNAYTGWVSSITTDGYAKFVVPATGAVGTHIVTLGHSEFGAPYMNPNQQPVVASRPFPHIPFTITAGTAVLPAPAEGQGVAVIAAKPVDKGIWASPYGATVGMAATLNAKALPANTDLDLTWTTMVGNRSVTGFEERTRALGKVRTDANGSFAWTFAVPDDLGGDHVIAAKIGEAIVAKTNLYILASAFPLSVDHGTAGTRTTIHLKGVGWTETEQIYHVVVDNAFTGYACAFQSAGDLTIFLTMSGAPGWHFIDMYPGIYQGTETRPANYKMPQLTALTDHPGNPLPIFRFAFLVQ